MATVWAYCVPGSDLRHRTAFNRFRPPKRWVLWSSCSSSGDLLRPGSRAQPSATSLPYSHDHLKMSLTNLTRPGPERSIKVPQAGIHNIGQKLIFHNFKVIPVKQKTSNLMMKVTHSESTALSENETQVVSETAVSRHHQQWLTATVGSFTLLPSVPEDPHIWKLTGVSWQVTLMCRLEVCVYLSRCP